MTGVWLTATDVSVYAGALLSTFAVLGLVVRYALVPYLRDQLVIPVKETHRQVTQNRHQNREPTVLDRIDDVHDAVQRVEASVVAVQAVANAAARSAGGAHRRLDQHVAWAREEDTRLWQAVTDPRHRAGNGEETT